ncbi:MAG: putative xanthine dehydrogenase subunit D [Firmicutes bacterium]|nr:putative xanthine dehydrogenase subunit D [Bacillota bacterium]
MRFSLNGAPQDCQGISDSPNLLWYLRNVARTTSVKNGCGEGVCGTCMVLVDGTAERACKLSLAQVEGKSVLTVEGLTEREQEIYVWAFARAGAVQCGFCTPGMVISAKALLDVNRSPSPEQIKLALRGNLCRCTGYVKIVEAVALAAEALRLTESKAQLSAECGVGSRFPRTDAPSKVLGKAVFTDDLLMPDLLYAAVLRSPLPRMRLHSMDIEPASSAPGVVAVLTAADIPGQRYHGYIRKDWPVLVQCGEETRYLGDALALVAARTEVAARAALVQIKLEYEELPPVSSPSMAMGSDAPVLHPGGNILSRTDLSMGDAGEAILACSHVVTAHYSTPMTEHAFLEPESVVAYPEHGVLVVESGSQSVHHDQQDIAAILNLPMARVRVVNNFVGGAFGGKEDLSVQHHAALLAWHTQKPVKLTLSRAESLLVHPKRHPMEIDITLGCDEQGTLKALQAAIVADTGAYASLGAPVLERACTHVTGPYRLPNVAVRGIAVYTNNPPAGAFRGFGVPQVAFAIESALDVLAERAGISPWEIRYRNALQEGDLLVTGQAVKDVHLRDTLLAVKADYSGNAYAGIACGMKNVGLGVGLKDVGRAVIEAADGKAVLYTGAACIGQGLASILKQVVCSVAALPADKVEVFLADTGSTPDSGATTASRQTLFTGEATRRAAEELARDLEASTLTQLNGRRYQGEYSGLTDSLQSDSPTPVTHVAYSFGTQVVILNANGRVKKVVAAYDVGRAINPTLLEGQVEGGIVMGLGYALTEDFPLSDCIPLAKTLGKLGLWRFTDTPEIKILLVEKNYEEKAFGAKGIGEIACIPTAPAVAGALFALDGQRRYELPLLNTAYRKRPVRSANKLDK